MNLLPVYVINKIRHLFIYMEENNLKEWLKLINFPAFGAVRLRKLINYEPDISSLTERSEDFYISAGIEPAIAQQYCAWRTSFNPQTQLEIIKRENIELVTLKDPSYPLLLKQIHTPPAVLFIKGKLPNALESIAVVGARKISNYGKIITPIIVKELANQGIAIVSGLALGIDGEAHRATLSQNGITVAVVATGIDDASIYPSIHRYLAKEIVQKNGAIISEFPPLTMALRHHFPMRNRIIAGLARATIVLEADEHSGALITARSALDENREVFAVPGPITSPTSRGTNQLIALGAHCLTNAQQIIEVLQLNNLKNSSINQEIFSPSDMEKTVLNLFTKEPLHTDEAIRLSGLPSPAVQKTIALLEMKGWLKDLGQGQYVCTIKFKQD